MSGIQCCNLFHLFFRQDKIYNDTAEIISLAAVYYQQDIPQ